MIMELSFLWTGLLLLVVHTAPMVEGISVSPTLMAQCGQNLSMLCNITHPLPPGTHVRMGWAHIDSNGVIRGDICQVNTSHPTNQTDDYICSLREGVYLELTLLRVNPDDRGQYVCKLISAVGPENAVTSVTLDECYTGQSVTTTAEALSCTFTGVFPEGEVHWFQGPKRLKMGSTTKQVEPRGGLTICGTLEINSTSGHLPYNCSLWSPGAQRYLTSQLVTVPSRFAGPSNATEAHRAFWKLGAILLASHFLMKLWA